MFSPVKYINSSTVVAEESAKMSPAAKTVKTAPCKGLKPVNYVDDLLYQFYINLDDDCLFKLPIEELEEIWGLKILSKERAKSVEEYVQLRDGPEFEKKPYNPRALTSGFYVRAYQDSRVNMTGFEINITHEFFAKHGTLFPTTGVYPEFLPRPLEKAYNEVNPPCLKFYFWKNSDQTRLILYRHPCAVLKVGQVEVKHIVRPDSTNQNNNAE